MYGKSTMTNLTSYVAQVIYHMHDGFTVDVIYMDFSKAFVRLFHSRLIVKLRANLV